MSPLKMVMKTIVTGLKTLAKEAERMEKLIGKLEDDMTGQAGTAGRRGRAPKKAATKRKPKTTTRAAKTTPTGKTAIEQVVEVIAQNKEGATTALIKEKTGLSERQIWAAINRAKKRGMVKSGGRGIYIKA